MYRINGERFLDMMMTYAAEDLVFEFDQVLDALKKYQSDGTIDLSTKKSIYWIFRIPDSYSYSRASVDPYSRESFRIRVYKHKQVIEIYYQPEGPIFDLLPPDLYRIRLPFLY